MSEYNYATKTIPLYHHEQVPFQSFMGHSDISPSSPAAKKELPLNPTMVLANSSGDLQEIICNYQSQPDLLKLILMSKLEEDKRRAEEAKLRGKELDLLLLQQQQQQPNTDFMSFNSTLLSSSPPSSPFIQQQQLTPPLTAATPSSTNSSTFDTTRRTSFSMMNDINPILMSSSNQCIPTSNPFFQQDQRRESNICSSFTDSDDFDDHTFSSMHTSSTPISSTSSLFNMDSMMATANFNDEKSLLSYSPATEIISPIDITNKNMKYESTSTSRPRRRREMQAITKIVETREYPYLDGYFWKNNGNTVQKKTGNKSVYYKCSNSNKGCPVNKTVTWKEHGEFLIKYRGEHLSECNRVQRIVDV